MTRGLLQTGSPTHVATGRNLNSQPPLSKQYSHTPKLFQSPSQMSWNTNAGWVCANAVNMGKLLLEHHGITGTLAVGVLPPRTRCSAAPSDFALCIGQESCLVQTSMGLKRLRQGDQRSILQIPNPQSCFHVASSLCLFVQDHRFEEAEQLASKKPRWSTSTHSKMKWEHEIHIDYLLKVRIWKSCGICVYDVNNSDCISHCEKDPAIQRQIIEQRME